MARIYNRTARAGAALLLIFQSARVLANYRAPSSIPRGTITPITTHVGMESNTRRSRELILPRPEPG